MLQSATGSLTIVDTNTDEPKLFWKGKFLEWVLSSATTNTRRGASRVTVRVVKPSKVSPELEETEQLRLTELYDEMTAAGIVVHKV